MCSRREETTSSPTNHFENRCKRLREAHSLLVECYKGSMGTSVVTKCTPQFSLMRAVRGEPIEHTPAPEPPMKSSNIEQTPEEVVA